MKKIITIVIIIIVVITIFFIKTNYKSSKFGNNKNIKTSNEIANYILGISSYEAETEITVKSNKNENKYKVIEKCSKDDNVYKKEVLEPENISGMIIEYDGANLKIENSRLSLKKMYENYKYLGEGNNTILDFIKIFNESEDSNIEEVNDQVIMSTKIKNGNKYISYKKLYIDKNSKKPTKMEIQDISQKEIIYILYNEIKINNLQKEDILAFKLRNNLSDI